MLTWIPGVYRQLNVDYQDEFLAAPGFSYMIVYLHGFGWSDAVGQKSKHRRLWFVHCCSDFLAGILQIYMGQKYMFWLINIGSWFWCFSLNSNFIYLPNPMVSPCVSVMCSLLVNRLCRVLNNSPISSCVPAGMSCKLSQMQNNF